MVIDWSSVVPAANGDTITSYTIEIFNPTTLAFATDLTNCNAA